MVLFALRADAFSPSFESSDFRILLAERFFKAYPELSPINVNVIGTELNSPVILANARYDPITDRFKANVFLSLAFL